MISHKWNIILPFILGIILSFSSFFICTPSGDILYTEIEIVDLREHGCPFSIFSPQIFTIGDSWTRLVAQFIFNFNVLFYFAVVFITLELIRKMRIRKTNTSIYDL